MRGPRIDSDRDQVKKLSLGYSDDVSVFLNGRILYRGRSAQDFRDPGFLGIVNPENDARLPAAEEGTATSWCWRSASWAAAGGSSAGWSRWEGPRSRGSRR